MNLLVLEGTPRERGRIHGEALRSEIGELLQQRQEDVQQAGGGKLEEYVDLLVENTGFVAAVEKWTPDLLQEVKGIAEGAGLDFKTTFAMQLLDESGWFFRRKLVQNSLRQGDNRCSALGVFGEGDGPALLAQTADMGAVLDGYLTLLHIKHADSPLEAYVVTLPGVVGVYGLNNRPVGVCLNAMGLRMNKSTDGLGTIFVSRGILAQPTLDDAIRFVHSVKHASGENYTIGGPDRVVALECSANKVSQFVPGATRVYHTNHPLVNDDTDDAHLEALVQSFPEAEELIRLGKLNTQTRFSSLEKRLSDTSQPVTVETIKSIVSTDDAPQYLVCRHKKPDTPAMTNAGFIMVLADAAELHIALGPPGMTEFQTLTF